MMNFYGIFQDKEYFKTMSMFNGTDDVCAFLSLRTARFNATWKRENLTDQLRAIWDINATWADRNLINPPMRQYQMARCHQDYHLYLQVENHSEILITYSHLNEIRRDIFLRTDVVIFKISESRLYTEWTFDILNIVIPTYKTNKKLDFLWAMPFEKFTNQPT